MIFQGPPGTGKTFAARNQPGNFAKVFGELYFLLEYRDEKRDWRSGPVERLLAATGSTLLRGLTVVGTSRSRSAAASSSGCAPRPGTRDGA